MRKLIVNIILLLLVAGLITSKASETSTNWSWISLRLIIPQTNFFVGERIAASIVISNTLESEHNLWLYAGDPCLCGPGKILITELGSGKEITCKFSHSERAGWADYYNIILQEHKSKNSETDLTKGFDITNAGVYSVQAIGWFPTSEPPTNRQNTTVTTPPIYIHLSSQVETSPPSK